jgi:ADP-ribose pyrophosphatase YjhB (NUDIX family)
MEVWGLECFVNSASLDFLEKPVTIQIMAIEVALHKIQRDILCKLVFTPGARFSDLKGTKVQSDQFSFHINQLVQHGLISKMDSRYCLTNKGKEFGNRFNTAKKQIEAQGRLFVSVIGRRMRNNKTEYLVQKRLKEPYFGCFGFVAGKIAKGEIAEDAARRELFEESGLTGRLTLQVIEHKIDYDKKKELLDDKHFYVFVADDVEGDLIVNFKGGKNIWMTKQKLFTSKKLFDDIKQLIDIVEKGAFVFVENQFVIDSF